MGKEREKKKPLQKKEKKHHISPFQKKQADRKQSHGLCHPDPLKKAPQSLPFIKGKSWRKNKSSPNTSEFLQVKGNICWNTK